jgi:hypothetical protein
MKKLLSFLVILGFSAQSVAHALEAKEGQPVLGEETQSIAGSPSSFEDPSLPSSPGFFKSPQDQAKEEAQKKAAGFLQSADKFLIAQAVSFAVPAFLSFIPLFGLVPYTTFKTFSKYIQSIGEAFFLLSSVFMLIKHYKNWRALGILGEKEYFAQSSWKGIILSGFLDLTSSAHCHRIFLRWKGYYSTTQKK